MHAGEILPLLKRHKIQVLLCAGHSQRDTAARVGVSVDTVARVKREDEVLQVDDAAERRDRRIGRPSKATPFGPKVAAWLAEEPDLPNSRRARFSRGALRALTRPVTASGWPRGAGWCRAAPRGKPSSSVRASAPSGDPRCSW